MNGYAPNLCDELCILHSPYIGDSLATAAQFEQVIITQALRQAISKAAVAHKKEWFKTIRGGEQLGELVFATVFTRMENSDFHKKLVMLEEWVLAK